MFEKNFFTPFDFLIPIIYMRGDWCQQKGTVNTGIALVVPFLNILITVLLHTINRLLVGESHIF